MNFKMILIIAVLMMLSVNVALASSNEIKPVNTAKNVTIPQGTIIKVQATHDMSSKIIRKNDNMHFKAIQDLVLADAVIVPAGTEVVGIAAKVRKAGSWDKDGELKVVFSEVKTERYVFPVDGVLDARGKKPNVLVRYSLGGILIKGKEAIIKAGTEVDLRVKDDVVIAL